MEKLYYSNSSLVSEKSLNELGLETFVSDKDCDEKYIDNDKLWEIINKISDDIEDSEIIQKLNSIGVYVDINFEVDSTLWEEE